MWNTDLSAAPRDCDVWLRVASQVYKAHWQSPYGTDNPTPANWADEYNRWIDGTPEAWAPIAPPPFER